MRDRVLSVIFVMMILGALGVAGYVMAHPEVRGGFTEFYILGEGRQAEAYPKELVVGEETKVVIGIVNREQETASYRSEVRIGGVKDSETESIVLEHNQKWEGHVSFTLWVAGENQKVEFLIYKDGDSQPYLEPLCLWIDVKE